MHTEIHTWYSQDLGRDMTLKSYGHGGKPILVFPSSGGSFHEYEDYGMIGVCADRIDQGKATFYCVESNDQRTWLAAGQSSLDTCYGQKCYEHYVMNEVLPFIRSRSGYSRFMTTGCSLGGYHAVNFLLKYPFNFDETIALSGVYSTRPFYGEYMDNELYFNSPVKYMAELPEGPQLDAIRQAQIIMCAGQGRWEEQGLRDLHDLSAVLTAKGVGHVAEYWGYDVDHDWPWWRRQMPWFLGYTGK